MTERDPGTGPMEQGHAGEHEPSQLELQTPGLDDPDVTSAIAGPDWDQELVDDATTSVGGTPLEGEIETDAPGGGPGAA